MRNPTWLQPTVETSIAYYAEVLGTLKSYEQWVEAQRELICGDLFYLMVYILGREDCLHPWLFDRCREVQAEPNGCLDLWSREHRKAIYTRELVPTPDGWKEHGDLRVGDLVFSPSGKKTMVIATTRVWEDSVCYRITFDDGASVVCDENHLWRVEKISKRRISGTNKRLGRSPVIMTTAEMSAHEHLDNKRLSVAVNSPVERGDKDLAIDPYVLGVWLGDGTASGPQITCGVDDVDEMEGLLISRGVDVRRRTHSNSVTLHLGNGIRGRKGSSDLCNALRSYNLFGNKHIPEIYLRGSVEQRLRLLQGLMDTDGWCNPRGTAYFCNTNENITRGLFELASSLGFKPSFSQRKNEFGPLYEICFQAYGDIPPFRLPRKLARCKPGWKPRRRFVRSVERVPSVPVSCIQVDSPDGLYLVGKNYVTTHNSSIITIGQTVRDILCDPEITIGIFSHTRPIAKSFLRPIKRTFENNKKLIELFPDILFEDPKGEAPQWSEDSGIVVKRKLNPPEATVEAHGLVDGMPTGRHFRLRVYDDVVTRESVTTAEQIHKSIEAFELSDNLGMEGGLCRIIGTRYCTIGSTRILMADWTHKPIQDVRVGDEVIGWKVGQSERRYLVKSRVLRAGFHLDQEVNEYFFENGRSVTCTPDHLWWRGAHWASSGADPKIGKRGGVLKRGREYAPLGFGYHQLRHIRQLCVPQERLENNTAGWLSGFFDGEGTVKKNENHFSGMISFTQSERNPEVIEKFKRAMSEMGFEFSVNVCCEGNDKQAKSYHFNLVGGWKEHYRFYAACAPSKNGNFSKILFSQLKTDRLALAKIEPRKPQDVYWLETETGNYVAEGFCSKNSLHDLYGDILKKGIAKPRLYPATHNGKMDGKPVLFSPQEWERRKKTQSRSTIAAQLLQNPLADEDAVFSSLWLHAWEVRPRTLAVAILGDPNRKVGAGNDNCAILAIGLSSTGNKYLLDGYCHQMTQSQRWTALRDLYVKWSKAPGVATVHVGYEKYGAEQDLNYFEERMDAEKLWFPIEELSWTKEGTKGEQGKRLRIERLEPDFRNSRFFLPYSVLRKGKPCVWGVDRDPESKHFQEVVYREVEGLSKAQSRAVESGDAELICRAIKRINQDGKIYDVTEHFIEEYLYFPFGEYKDALDSASRFYDMEMTPPNAQGQKAGEPPQFWDS